MGTLYIVSTPIGNLEDITIRAIKTIFSAHYIACEDTRRTGMLIDEISKRYAELLNINTNNKPKLISFYDQNEFQKLPEIIKILESDQNLALVSDAGTPLISDPGFKLVSECLKRNINIQSVPGPSAVTAALSVSGANTNQFIFLGYLNEKASHRLKQLNNLVDYYKNNHPTIIFYCAPHKLKTNLTDLMTVFGDIQITIVRELTKIHEQVWKNSISNALKEESLYKGEIVVLF